VHFKSTHIFYPLTQRLSHQNDIIFTKVHHIIDHSNVFLVLDIPNYLSSREDENHEDWGMDIFQAMFTSSLHFIEYGNIKIWSLRPLLRAKGHNFAYNNNHTFLTCPVKFTYTISIPVFVKSNLPHCETNQLTHGNELLSFIDLRPYFAKKGHRSLSILFLYIWSVYNSTFCYPLDKLYVSYNPNSSYLTQVIRTSPKFQFLNTQKDRKCVQVYQGRDQEPDQITDY